MASNPSNRSQTRQDEVVISENQTTGNVSISDSPDEQSNSNNFNNDEEKEVLTLCQLCLVSNM